MTQSKKRKLEHPSTAAYAASQPLFDAFRTGCTKVDDQKTHLTAARDLVQTIHVKITSPDDQGDVEKHERYVRCALDAWKSALDTYTDIFEELVNITAADASVGKQAAQGHDHFRALSKNVAGAKRIAASIRAQPTKASSVAHKVGLQQGNTFTSTGSTSSLSLAQPSERSIPDGEQSPQSNDQPPRKAPRLSEGDPLARKSSMPEVTRDLPEKEMSRVARRARDRRQRTKERRKANGTSVGQGQGAGNLKTSSTPVLDGDNVARHGSADARSILIDKENTVPGVQYEDVSAEVNARLEAKAEVKRAKKEAKKRKRESLDSSLMQPADDALANPKKKSKTASSNGAEAVPLASDQVAEKRKQEVEVEDDGGGRKKRKGFY